MTQLELDVQNASKLLEEHKRMLIEDRLLISQWCKSLKNHYDLLAPELKEQLPPLIGTTPEEMLPSLFVEDIAKIDTEQYAKESKALQDLQTAMNALLLKLNQEAIACLSQSMPQQ